MLTKIHFTFSLQFNSVSPSTELNLALLASAVRDNASSSSEVTVSRNSFGYLSTAFVTGFALGAAVGLLSAGVFLHPSRLRSNSDHLQEEAETVRRELHLLRSAERSSPIALEAYLDDEDNAEDNDEFFDVSSGLSGDTNGDFFSVRSSSAASLFSLGPPPDAPLPREVANELDELMEVARLADTSSASEAARRAFSRCLDYKKQYKHYPGFLWRFARAAHFMWMATTAMNANASDEGNDNNAVGDDEADDHWVDAGLSIARSAVRQADAARAAATAEGGRAATEETANDAARSYQWLAVFLGLSATSTSTSVSQRIQMGYEFENFIDVSLKLDPSNAFCHILKGRWCYEVYNLSWLERQLASRLFAAPPTATLEDAKAEFLEAERLEPNRWAVNAVFLAKCEFAGSHYAEAMRWLETAEQLLISHTDDANNNAVNEEGGDDTREYRTKMLTSIGDAVAERPSLLAEIASLKPRYRAYLPN